MKLFRFLIYTIFVRGDIKVKIDEIKHFIDGLPFINHNLQGDENDPPIFEIMEIFVKGHRQVGEHFAKELQYHFDHVLPYVTFFNTKKDLLLEIQNIIAYFCLVHIYNTGKALEDLLSLLKKRP